ncbi:MAG TPA: hypothetical protein DCM02_03425 [Flavobacterium sp.]|nr:hypothetical protein [Flavobacterium sp.]
MFSGVRFVILSWMIFICACENDSTPDGGVEMGSWSDSVVWSSGVIAGERQILIKIISLSYRYVKIQDNKKHLVLDKM